MNGNVATDITEKRTGKILAAFSFGQLQDYLTLSGMLAASGITIEDLTAYVNAVKGGQGKAGDANKNMPDCPVCGEKLGLQVITTPQGRANINGYKSVWYCQSVDCNYEDYSMNDVKTEIKRRTTNDPA